MERKATTVAKDMQAADQEPSAIAVSAGGAAIRNGWRNIRLIIGREYKNHITQRSFIITSILLLIIVALAAFVPTVVQFISARSSSSSQTHIALVNNAGPVGGLQGTALASFAARELNGTDTSSQAPYALASQVPAAQASLEKQVKNGSLDILLVLQRSAQGNLQFVYYAHTSSSNDSDLSNIQALVQQLNFLDAAHRLGLTPAQTSSLVAPPALTIVYTLKSKTRSTGEIVTGYILAFAGNILVYISVTLYALGVAMGVGEEKGSRVMEVLINAATPLQLMLGKIIGIGAAGLTQMACMIAVGLAALFLQIPLQAALFGPQAGGFLNYLTGVSVPFYLLFLLYFMLAFLLYATLFAGLGALVKRQDEVRSAVQIPTLLMVASYVLVYFAIITPGAPWVKFFSYIPFSTSTMMLVRLSLGQVAWWEVPLTIAIMLLAISACTWFSARLYRLGVLMYGQKPGLGRVLKLAFGR